MSDLIGREVLMQTLQNEHCCGCDLYECCDEDDCYMGEIFQAVRSAPITEAEPRWIPVTERLPENPGYGEEYPLVIFCTDKRSYVGFYEYYKDGLWWNYTADGDYVVGGVIAWMPLPEPYKMNGVKE